jgi:hypothetical protein
LTDPVIQEFIEWLEARGYVFETREEAEADGRGPMTCKLKGGSQ